MREQIRSAASRIAESVRTAPLESKQRAFYDGLRSSDIPFLGALISDPSELFRLSFEALSALGRSSVPLTVAFTMHQYMFAALATAGGDDPIVTGRRRALLRSAHQRRALIAVSSFGGNLSLPDVRFSITKKDGRFSMNGLRSFQSMAGEADLLTVAAPVDGAGLGSFIVPLKDRPDVLIGSPVFSGPMALTDTRSVTFSDYHVGPENVVTLDEEESHDLGVYSTAWFEGLIPAAYLGGAASALDELRRFARGTRLPSGESLCDLDGTIVDAGRLGILLKTSLALAGTFEALLCTLAEDQDPTNALTEAALIKYVCTRNAEAIVQGVRRLIGTRAMRPEHPIAELTGQVAFGPLHPWLEAETERAVGAQVLGDEPFCSFV